MRNKNYMHGTQIKGSNMKVNARRICRRALNKRCRAMDKKAVTAECR